MRLNDGGRTVAAMDVLAPAIGEIIGGSRREQRIDLLDLSMAECGIDKEHYAWYRDLRRYGTVTPPPPLPSPACGGVRGWGLRAHPRLRHRPRQRPRRHPLPANTGEHKVLIYTSPISASA
jgi:hypothetical protein